MPPALFADPALVGSLVVCMFADACGLFRGDACVPESSAACFASRFTSRGCRTDVPAVLHRPQRFNPPTHTHPSTHPPPPRPQQVRVVQRNLVYAVGLPLRLCSEEQLADRQYFGAYGRIKKVSVNRSTPFSQVQRNGPTGSAYVTYCRPEDALRCIETVDGLTWDGGCAGSGRAGSRRGRGWFVWMLRWWSGDDGLCEPASAARSCTRRALTTPLAPTLRPAGKVIKACFGTTKYCNAFLKGVPCNNSDCLYLHEIGEQLPPRALVFSEGFSKGTGQGVGLNTCVMWAIVPMLRWGETWPVT